MKKTLSVLLFSLLLSFCTQAQSYNIIKSQAFFRTSTAGNVQVDENGTPEKAVTKDYLIFIETKGSSQPQWETAYIDGLPYTIRTAEVRQTPLSLGPLKGRKIPVTIHKRKNSQLWQLALTPQQSTEQVSPTANTQTITLSGTFRGKAIRYRITKVRELAKRFNP